MVESASLRVLQGVAKLSGSFALSGLVAACVPHGKAHQAFAYSDPFYSPYLDLPYPVRRASGKIVKVLPTGSVDVKYPVQELLKSPWETFLPEPVAWAFFKSFAIYSAIYLQGWIQAYNEAEERAREEAESEDEDLEVDMPEINLQDIVRVLKCSVRGGIRDVSTTCIRRILEWRVAARVSDRMSWKLVKDFSRSTKRKLSRHSVFAAMPLTARTTLRSNVLMQVADFIYSTTLDAYKLLMLPFLPVGWQQRFGLRRYGFPPAPPPPLPPRPELDPADVQDPAAPAEDAAPDAALYAAPVDAAEGAVPDVSGDAVPDAALAEQQLAAWLVEPAHDAQGSPADWRWRFGFLAKKAAGNAARCCVSLGAASIGAGLTAPLVPISLLPLACNGADMVVAIFVTNPDLNDWYERGLVPWRTFGFALLSLGITMAILSQGSKGHRNVARS